MADVNVTFSAVDEGYSAGIEKMRQQERTLTQNLTPGGPGSGVLTPLPAGLGGAPKPPGGGFRVLSEEEREAARAANELAEAQDKAGKAAQRHGINFEAMAQRMAVRLVVFEAIRLAIQGVKAAMTEAESWETISTRFKNLSLDAQGADAELGKIADTAKRIGASKEEMAGLELSLQRGGESAHDAAIETETLAEYATVGGEKMGTLGDEMTRLKVGSGTIPDMENLVELMGKAGTALHEAIESYKTEEVQLKRIEEQISRNAQLEERSIERTNQLRERSINLATRLEERGYEEQQRLERTVEDFSDKLGIAKMAFDKMRDPFAHMGGVKIAGVDLTEQEKFMENRERMGEEQIAQEEHLSLEQVRRLEAAGLINEKDLLAAHQRAVDEERRAQKNTQEDARESARNQAEDQRQEARNKAEDEHYDRRHKVEEEGLALQTKVYQAVNQRLGLENETAKVLETAAAHEAAIAERAKSVADNSIIVKGAIGAWNTALDTTITQFEKLDGLVKDVGTALSAVKTPQAETQKAASAYDVTSAIFKATAPLPFMGDIFRVLAGPGPSTTQMTPEGQRALQLLERSAKATEDTNAHLRTLTTQ